MRFLVRQENREVVTFAAGAWRRPIWRLTLAQLFFFLCLCEQGGLAVTVISIVAMLIILYQDGVR